MKTLFLTSYYPPFLNRFFLEHPNVKDLDYNSILNLLLNEHFADTGALEYHTKKAGHETFLIISNCEILQKKWAIENNVSYNPEKWITEIAFEQIKRFKPDLFYLEYVFEFFGEFLTSVKPYCKFIASWISSPLNHAISVKGVDLIFSSTPDFIQSFKSAGFNSEYMHPAFDKRILNKINTNNKKDIPFSFVGGLSEYHIQRKIALKALVKKTPLKIWGYVTRKKYSKRQIEFYTSLVYNENNQILKAHQGDAWGLRMYDILSRSLITFNIHEDLLKGYVGNIRMFEATGVGTLLLNDKGTNLTQLFEPGKEIEVYSSIDEAIEKVNYYIKHPDKAIEIGKNAQLKTIKNYNYDEYVKKLFYYIHQYSGMK
jgi:spore maturation protein CgeB